MTRSLTDAINSLPAIRNGSLEDLYVVLQALLANATVNTDGTNWGGVISVGTEEPESPAINDVWIDTN